MRGRKPKPTQLKLVDGNPGHKPLNMNEPQPVGDLAEPPEWLSPSQVANWNYAIDNAPAKLLKKLDKNILTVYVIAEDLYFQASQHVNRNGLVVRSPVKGEPMQNPYLAILNKQSQILIKAAAEMGFTPSSRSRIVVQEEEVTNDNPFAQFNRR